ncbi:hypothetical protein B0E50_01715 [Rhodanobacter sp. C01]|nr:hypothetical protein B0E50_01715 [Rhodanobacter sp. C01]
MTVTEPGDIVKYTFGDSYANNEGWLLQTETDSLSGQVQKVVTNTYLTEDQVANQAFPPNVGQSVLGNYKNPMVGRLRPVVSTVTVQDGDTYTHQNVAFDVFARPNQVNKYNNVAGQVALEDQTTYYDDLMHWVLGQIQQVVNMQTGETEIQRVYDPATALMKSQSRFGEPLLSYTYFPAGQPAAGQLASFTDGNNQTTTLGNYYRGIPQLIGYPDNTSQSATVDDYGEIISVTDQASHTTQYSYTSSGWPYQIIYPTGDEVAWLPKTFAFAYITAAERGISSGHWRRTVSTGNATEVTYFDAMLRPLLSDSSIAGTTGSDITSANSYDWRGLTTFASYPIGGAPDLSAITSGTSTTYDTLGRVSQIQRDSELGTLTTTMSYLSGAGKKVTDPNSNVSTTYYQVFDEPSYNAPIKVQVAGAFNPNLTTQVINRDVYGNPLSITQSGPYNGTETDSVTKTLTYDNYHRLCRTTEPESANTVMGYDGANNLQWSAAGLSISGMGCGQDQVADTAKTTFTYYPTNRLWTVVPPTGTQSTQYHYTAVGDMDSAISGTSTWGGTYNFRGMLTGESLQVVSQNAWTLGYAHDAYGSVSLIRYPNGENVSYAPDALGRATQVGGYASAIGYWPNGQVKQFVFGNGTAYVTEQNARQLLSNFTYGTAGGTNLSEDLLYDPDGNITHVNDLANGPRTKTFGYDGLNRLISAVAPGLWGTESYQYDPLNNLRTRVSAGQTLVYNYDPTNRLQSITQAGSTLDSFGYDNRGNEIGRNANSLVFDQKDQLTLIQGYGSYQYDASGRRTTKTLVDGSSIYSFYNHGGQLMFQHQPAAAVDVNFIYLGSKQIAHESIPLPPASAPFITVPSASPSGSYTINWSVVPATTYYVLQENQYTIALPHGIALGNGQWTNVQNGSATSWNATGKGGGGYGYQVQACNAVGCGPWSSIGMIAVGIPAAPTNARIVSGVSSTGATTYTAEWDAVPGASKYELQVPGMIQLTYNGPATSYLVTTNIKPGTFNLNACNSAGCSDWVTVALSAN